MCTLTVTYALSQVQPHMCTIIYAPSQVHPNMCQLFIVHPHICTFTFCANQQLGTESHTCASLHLHTSIMWTQYCMCTTAHQSIRTVHTITSIDQHIAWAVQQQHCIRTFTAAPPVQVISTIHSCIIEVVMGYIWTIYLSLSLSHTK